MSTDRNNVRALFEVIVHESRMGESGWKERLRVALDGDGRSYSEISTAAGKGRNFISQMFKDKKAPSIDNLAAICSVLRISPIYVWTGAPVDPHTEELLVRWARASKKQQAAILALLPDDISDPPEDTPDQ